MSFNNDQKHSSGSRAHAENGDDRNTRSYRHVKLDRQRPQLTRGAEAEAGQERAQERKKNQHRKRRQRASEAKKSSVLKVIPLGGLDAIGKNMTVFECDDDLVLDDAGLMFPDDNHPGVDLILPDYTYLLENADKLRGIVITHGHEDHTGSLPYVLKDLDRDVPIYATKLTLGLIEGKFAEHKIKNAQLIEIKPGDVVKLGCITAESSR